MSEPILDPSYWRGRLHRAPSDALHHAIYRCPLDRWKKIEEKHRSILSTEIKQNDSVLDPGCGYGRLLTLLPEEWRGAYHGLDLSPDFIALARENHQGREFSVGDLRYLPQEWTDSFDWAVITSVRHMVIGNLGGAVWDVMEKELRRLAKHLLFLEYDENNNGSIE